MPFSAAEGPVADEDVMSLPLGERVHNSKWKVRHEAFKEMNHLFY